MLGAQQLMSETHYCMHVKDTRDPNEVKANHAQQGTQDQERNFSSLAAQRPSLVEL